MENLRFLMKEEWDSVYKQRKNKVGKKKAKKSANAYVKSILAKNFILEEDDEEKESLDLKPKKKKEYKRYLKGKYEVILTTDKSVLKDFPKEKIKGQIKDLNKDKYMNIINDISKDYDISINEYLYYVILENE